MTTPPVDIRKSDVDRSNSGIYPLGQRESASERETVATEPVAASAYGKGTSGSTTQTRHCARLLRQARTIR
jgi:hypothetical protein